MKTLITTLMLSLALLTPQAFAGGSGGGGVLMDGMAVNSPEIVLHVDQRDGFIKFKYGQLVDGLWQIVEVEMNENDVMSNELVRRSLEMSLARRNWVEIK